MLPDLKLIFRTYPCLRISGSAVPSIERLYGGDSSLSSQPELKEETNRKRGVWFQNKSTEKQTTGSIRLQKCLNIVVE